MVLVFRPFVGLVGLLDSDQNFGVWFGVIPFLVNVVLGNFVSCVSFPGVVSFIDFVYLITVILGFCCCMFGFC